MSKEWGENKSNLKTALSRSRWRSNSRAWEMAVRVQHDQLLSLLSDLKRRSWSDINGWERRYPIINRKMKVSPRGSFSFPSEEAKRFDTHDRSKQPRRGREDKWTASDSAELLWARTNDSPDASHLLYVSAWCLMSASHTRTVQQLMKEEPCSVIVATCLTPNFVYYIENCSTSTQQKKKAWFLNQCVLGSLTEMLFSGTNNNQ